MATSKQLDDLSECPICTEVYSDPRVLPCGHTLCLECIEAWSKNKQAGNKMRCPYCRKEFGAPRKRIRDLPKNFFVANFLQMRELSSVESTKCPCDVCSSSGEETESKVQNVASVFCVECQTKLCHGCERAHKGLKLTRFHRLVGLGNKNDAETLYHSLSPNMKSCNDLTLVHIIPGGRRESVTAVASLGNDVFVMRYNSQQVEVHDAETFAFTLHYNIAVPRLGSWTPSMVACGTNKCLYLSDSRSSVHRVQLSGRNAVKKWSVARSPAGLSVNSAQNLVVACTWANKLQEYRRSGSLVREIYPQEGVAQPWHAVQLSTGHYAVSQNTTQGVVSVVGVDGQVVRSYGQSATSDVGPLKCPRSIAVTKNDDILVADRDNNRILSIDTSSGCLRQLALPVEDGICQPCGLCLDESRGRLYVGEWGGGHRVLVFDGVTF